MSLVMTRRSCPDGSRHGSRVKEYDHLPWRIRARWVISIDVPSSPSRNKRISALNCFVASPPPLQVRPKRTEDEQDRAVNEPMSVEPRVQTGHPPPARGSEAHPVFHKVLVVRD